MKKHNSKIFYGWIVAFAGFLMTGLSVGLQTNCNVAFLKPLSESMGFSISQIALINSLIPLAAIPCYIIIPKILKRISFRKFTLISGTGYLVFKILFALSTSLWQFNICSIMIGMCIPGISYMMVNSLIDGWFYERKGLALGIAATGAGVSGAVFLPVITRVIEMYGWRNGYLFQAAIISIMLTAALLMIRNTPESIGLKPLGYKVKETDIIEKQGYTLQQTIKMPAYYLLLLGIFCISTVGLGIQPYLMSSLGDAGYSAIFASKIVSIILIVSTIGKIVMGAVFDRFGTKYVGIFIGVFFVLSLLLLCVAGNHILIAYLFAFAFGISYVTLSIPVPYLIMELFGSKEFTAIYGVALIVTAMGSSIGSILTGFIYDNTGSYKEAWMLYIAISAVLVISIQIAYRMVKSEMMLKNNLEVEYE